jgi:hypothetical protein
MAQIASLLPQSVSIPRPDNSWLDGIAESLGGLTQELGARKSFNALADRIGGAPAAAAPQQGGFLSRLTGGAPQVANAPMTAPVGPVDRGPAQGSTYAPFIDTIKTKVTNPYGLAAVAATGRAESGWSPVNAARSWSDPSQSGQAGTAGGILSWRAERLQNLQNYARSKGEEGNGSPSTQAEFFLSEDPGLIDRLNAAKSPQEAQQVMNNAWKFAGYDQPGGETARRMALAQNYYAQDFRDGQGAPAAAPAAAPARVASNLVASLDPSAGIPMPGATGQMRASDPAQPMPVATPAVAAAPQPSAAAALAQPPVGAPVPAQVADSGSNIIAPGVTPVTRGSVDPSLIQFMLRDPNLRETGLQLWAANVKGQAPTEPWQFVNLPDGTLARANQQTGQVERLGTFAKPQDPIKVGDGDTLLDPVTKQPIFTGKPKSTAGQQDYEYAMKQLRERGVPEDKLPTFQEFSKPKSRGITFRDANGTEIQIGGDTDGAAYSGTSLPAEVGARIGLGDNFIKNDYPEVIKMIKNGDATGPIDYAQGIFGRGNSGIVQRRMASGADALRRGLTGAGMSVTESEEYARRYLPQPTDDAETLLRKAEGLKDDLESVTSGAIKGKAGDVGGFMNKKQPEAPKAGQIEDGYRFKGGDPADPKSWEKAN